MLMGTGLWWLEIEGPVMISMPMQISEELDTLELTITRSVGISNQVADFLRRLIFSRTLRPGQRVVETRIARRLRVGQPTVREALNTLEAEGLVVRIPNIGCSVTQLTEKEYKQIFRVRAQLEPLAIELALQNRKSPKARELRVILNKMKKAARESEVVDYYHADFELHKAIWHLAENPFLERALSQLVLPVFAIVQIDLFVQGGIDLANNVRQHERLLQAILTDEGDSAGRLAKQMLEEFEREGLALLRKVKKSETKEHRF
jgi:DNA-binding GntR family transcriptional regulator